MLTYTDFITIYPTTTLTQGKVEQLLASYKVMLSQYFRFDDISTSKFFDVDGCGANLVSIPVFELNNTLLVEGYDIRTRMLTTLVSDIDFGFKTFDFNDLTFVYALDFNCLGCVCECERIKVTGLWKPKLPTYLEAYIYEIINTSPDECGIIESENIGEGKFIYKNMTSLKGFINLDQVLSFPLIQQSINAVLPYFIQL